MSIEATAEALATEMPVAPTETTTETIAPEPTQSEDDMLAAAFDKLNSVDDGDDGGDPIEELPDVVEDAPEEGNEAEAEEKDDSDAGDEDEHGAEAEDSGEPAPSDLPRGVREAWKEIPETARDAIAASHRELTAKLGQQGRQLQGIEPIKDVLVQAVERMPQMADMTPQQVAREVFSLAQLSHNFTAKPVETLLGYIKQHGLEGQMAAALQGQNPGQDAQQVAALNRQLRQMANKVEQLSDPNFIKSQVSQFTSETQMNDTVTQFAAKAEHWGAVETKIPLTIPIARETLGEGASPQDVLSRAYELAVSQFVPDAKAKTEAADVAATKVDPAKTKAQIRAKSVNVKSTSTGRSKPKSEDELMSEIYDKNSK